MKDTVGESLKRSGVSRRELGKNDSRGQCRNPVVVTIEIKERL